MIPTPGVFGNVRNVKIIVMACKYYHFKSFNEKEITPLNVRL